MRTSLLEIMKGPEHDSVFVVSVHDLTEARGAGSCGPYLWNQMKGWRPVHHVSLTEYLREDEGVGGCLRLQGPHGCSRFPIKEG